MSRKPHAERTMMINGAIRASGGNTPTTTSMAMTADAIVAPGHAVAEMNASMKKEAGREEENLWH